MVRAANDFTRKVVRKGSRAKLNQLAKTLHTLVVSGSGSLEKTFGVPPFSVLDARQGYWKSKKQDWLSIGIQSELGRGDDLIAKGNLYSGDVAWAGNRGARVRKANATPGGQARPAMKVGENGRTVRGDGYGRPLATTYGTGGPADLANGYADPPKTSGGYNGIVEEENSSGTGTSIFDPVLCELSYRWYCPPNGEILDPFAGGSVRGVVAGVLGYQYTGIDLSERQIKANKVQGKDIAKAMPKGLQMVRPRWFAGDSQNIKQLAGDRQYDLIFSCPPYMDLEVYSNDARDISTMTTEGFLHIYRKIIRRSLALLKDNRFAVFVVGNSRRDHFYTHLPKHTISIFEEFGARLYNEAVLVTAVGSLPLRTRKQFMSGRKLGRTHQDVLVFVKGDWKEGTRACTPKKTDTDPDNS